MENSNKIERSEVWNSIYNVVKKMPLKDVDGDCIDAPSAATEIEQIIEKLLPIHNVVFSEAELKAKLEEQKEEIRQWLIDEDFEGLAERL